MSEVKKPDNKQLINSNIITLVQESKHLTLVLDVDKDALLTELEPYTVDLGDLDLKSKTFKVTDDATNQECIDLMGVAADKKKGLDKIIARFKTPLNQARSTVLELESKTAALADAIRKRFSVTSGEWIMEQRRAKQRAAESVARVTQQHQRSLVKEAAAMIMEGRVEEGAALQQQAAMTVPPSLPAAIAPVTGARITPKFTGELTDSLALMKAIVSGHVDLMQEVAPGDERPLMVVDQVVLNALVKRQGDGLNLPGVTVKEVVGVSSRGAR